MWEWKGNATAGVSLMYDVLCDVAYTDQYMCPLPVIIKPIMLLLEAVFNCQNMHDLFTFCDLACSSAYFLME